MRRFWKKYHKWVGLFFTFFILMFCISGIILNHRHFFAGCDMSRAWMPSDYKYVNWNNGVVKGTFRLSNGKVLCYGNTGIWQTDSCFSVFSSFNNGLKTGNDNRKISNIVHLPDGSIWCAGLYDVYRLSDNSEWIRQTVMDDVERVADIYARGDTLIVMTRSNIFEALPPYSHFKEYELPAPDNYSPKVSMFRTIWLLHSGELFGLPGQLFVDFIAVVIIILCLTGLVYFFLPLSMKHRSRRKLSVKKEGKVLKFSVKWHNRLGAWLIVFTVLLAVTGGCLRPPLMIPFVMMETRPVPGSTMDSDNPWHDKFRSIRWDENLHAWLISTSAGFYHFTGFADTPKSFTQAPPTSPMGINVFHQQDNGEWLVGSFSGLFCWNPQTGKVTDYYTGAPFAKRFGPPVSTSAVSGFSTDIAGHDEVVFDYSSGTRSKTGDYIHISDMPEEIENQPMSLWNFALELHVGRCYSPFLGPLSSMFVFLSGLFLSLTLISGYILHPRKRKPKQK